MKNVFVTLESGDTFVTEEKKSFAEIRQQYREKYPEALVDIHPKVDFLRPQNNGARPYAGKLTFLKLQILLEHADLEKLAFDPVFEKCPNPYLFWDDYKGEFRVMNRGQYQMSHGHGMINLGVTTIEWLMFGVPVDLKSREVYIKRYHTNEPI